jgi:hypothetical protein
MKLGVPFDLWVPAFAGMSGCYVERSDHSTATSSTNPSA